MRAKTRFELLRWSYFVILFILGTACIFIITELMAAPLLRWIFFDHPYSLPTWSRTARISLAILFISLVAGTAAWWNEKRQSGR